MCQNLRREVWSTGSPYRIVDYSSFDIGYQSFNLYDYVSQLPSCKCLSAHPAKISAADVANSIDGCLKTIQRGLRVLPQLKHLGTEVFNLGAKIICPPPERGSLPLSPRPYITRRWLKKKSIGTSDRHRCIAHLQESSDRV